MSSTPITSFLVKVASRCNLDCDYCYVYNHADQSWRSLPKLLSADDQAAFANRLSEYIVQKNLKHCAVVFHGGEPLLAGTANLVQFTENIRAATSATIDVGLQTNGLLLTEATIRAFEEADITVSLSLDGPREVNDKHRLSQRRRSSFDKVLAALERLKRHPKVFAGVIAVIDASTSPNDVLAFFDEHRPPKVDFLLPDAHHLCPPPGRSDVPDLYEKWQRQAFDLWLDQYPHLPIRTFEALLDTIAGLPSTTDAFGLGDVSLICIETDGSYHDLDVLKVTKDGATKIGGTVQDTSIAEIANSSHIAAHRRLLTKNGLCATCRTCPIVEICGGGSLPHRYGPNGFDNPTIYCREMTALVAHARARLKGLLQAPTVASECLPADFDLERFERAELAQQEMSHLYREAKQILAKEFLEVISGVSDDSRAKELADAISQLEPDHLDELSFQPGAVAWQRARSAAVHGREVYSVDGHPVAANAEYLANLLERSDDLLRNLAVGCDDFWLRAPFGNTIYFESEDITASARPIVEEALAIIYEWRPALANELRQACRAIQFIRDPLAHPEKIVSFSDESVPGTLYVSVWQGDRLIDPYDLADSLVHEHRHQKLYLLERIAPTVHATEATVVSPWREDVRPPSGLLHAVFVFVELRRFWIHVRDHGPARLHNRAVSQIRETDHHLAEAFETLETCPLTDVGLGLVEVLKKENTQFPELS